MELNFDITFSDLSLKEFKSERSAFQPVQGRNNTERPKVVSKPINITRPVKLVHESFKASNQFKPITDPLETQSGSPIELALQRRIDELMNVKATMEF